MRNVVRIDGRYTLEEELGKGSCGEQNIFHMNWLEQRFLSATVYHAQDIITKQIVAIKLECIMDKPESYLEHKYTVLNQLHSGNGVPQPLWFGREGSYRAMVLEILSPSLDKLIQVSSDGIFGLGRVIELGLQIVSSSINIPSHLNLSDP